MTIDPQELSDSDLYLQLTLTVEKWIDSILFDERGENIFSRIIFGHGYFSNFIQLSPYFVKEQKKIGNYKWKLGCYKKIPLFINNFQNLSGNFLTRIWFRQCANVLTQLIHFSFIMGQFYCNIN